MARGEGERTRLSASPVSMQLFFISTRSAAMPRCEQGLYFRPMAAVIWDPGRVCCATMAQRGSQQRGADALLARLHRERHRNH